MFQTTSNRRPWLRWFVDNENPARVCGTQKGGRAGSREDPHQGLGRISIRANTLGAVNVPDGTSGNCQRPAPQSSSASRLTAGAAGFLLLTQCRERPERYIEPLRFDTMPSSPILQAWAKTVGPSPRYAH